MMKNNIHDTRAPDSQNNYSPDELRVLLNAHNKGITAQELADTLNRSVVSVRKKASSQGVALRKLK